ncbi:S-adenosyl-L-methionine-dependent methyltransferase [Nemania sp. FL0916]|nr:S-adenosyl-L-methionine-dependent methyltransferase [Nemania sp. FL0916]
MAASTPASALPRIRQLSKLISESVSTLENTLTSLDVPLPSFDEDSPLALPDDVAHEKDVILDASAEIFDLLLDPASLILYHGAHANCTCFQAIARFGIASMVPIGGQVSFTEIANQARLAEDMVQRLLRFAMTMRVFREPEPGFVAHTKASKLLFDETMTDWLAAGTEEMWPACSRMVEALQRWPAGSEPNETGFQIAHSTSETMYSVISSDPVRGKRFANSMKFQALSPAFGASHIVENFDWAALGPAKLVDVGGSQGHISIAIAAKFDNLSVVVQDRGEIVADAGAGVPTQLKERISFMPHDIFSPQPIRADVYLLRWILHNWSDKYCMLILGALIPALKQGARILVAETCMPEPGEAPLWREKQHRVFDMTMAAGFNAKERSKKEWEALFSKVDPRLVLESVVEPSNSALALMTIVFNENN